MKGYLLSVEELNSGLNGQQLLAEAIQKLDAHRQDKVNRLRAGKTQNQAVGAGLLLQLAVRERNLWSGDFVMEKPELSALLEQLGEPFPIAYRHGKRGKPDFADGIGHFNISHSENYVCAVFDRREIGVDIQWMRPLRNMRVAERYFSPEERHALEDCPDREMRERLFYRIWVKKESYAKLTGEGIAAVVEQDTFAPAREVIWREWEMPEGYCMAICQYRENIFPVLL